MYNLLLSTKDENTSEFHQRLHAGNNRRRLYPLQVLHQTPLQWSVTPNQIVRH